MNAAKTISLLSLGATIVPTLLFITGTLPHDAVKWITLAGTLVWFVATPMWMGRELSIDAKEVEI